MIIKENTLLDFQRITNFPIENFIKEYISFLEVDYYDIIDYYSSKVSTPNVQSFNKLYSLIKDSFEILEVFTIHSKIFRDISYWNLLEQIENYNSKLQTISNIYLYLRSFLNKNQFVQGSEGNLVLNQYETLEQSVVKNFGSLDGDNDWVDLAIYNLLSEEGYKAKEGVILKAFYPQEKEIFSLESVLGGLKGEYLYGIDLKEKIEFVDNDILKCSTKETISTTIKRYLQMKVGDNPEFPNDGMQVGLFVGNNIGSLLFPVLFRQQSDLFRKDDTIFSFSVVNIKYFQGAIYIDYEIQTRFGEIYKETKQVLE